MRNIKNQLIEWFSSPSTWLLLFSAIFTAGTIYDSITSSIASQNARLTVLELSHIEEVKTLSRIEGQIREIHDYFGVPTRRAGNGNAFSAD